jgi:uncharacterized repeat protein (TIGR01451 family)
LTIPVTGASSGPSIAIVKTASISSFSASGTLVTYSYEVTNTGNVTLNPVTVTDPMSGLSPITCPATSLAVGADETCTATYTTTTANVTAGWITNTGTATGTPPGGPPVTASQTLTIPYLAPTIAASSPPPYSAISLVKTPSTNTYDTAGQVVTYTYVITNTGDVSLGSDQYTVSDNKITGGAAFDCGAPQTLAVGASITCTNTYTITAGDLSSGTVTNLASATNGPETSGVATATITAAATTTITTVIHSSPSSIPPTKIPSSAPQTGLGGSAKVVYNSGFLDAGGVSIVAGLVLMVLMIRRRRRA